MINASTKRILCIAPTTTLTYAYELMREHPLRHLPVVDGKKLVGIVSDRDLLLYGNRVTEHQLTFPGLPVTRIMSTKLITARIDATIAHVAALMLGSKVSSVLLTENGDTTLMGLVTSSDLVALLVSHHEPLPFRYELTFGGAPNLH